MMPSAGLRELVTYRRPSGADLHFPFDLNSRKSVATYNGSAAIAAVVNELNLGPDDGVLLPAYYCGAEAGPFKNAGCQLYFYDIHEDLSANRAQIQSAVALHADIKLLFITHYFGIAQPGLQELAQWCQARQLTLVEDCAHALYGTCEGVDLGSVGDYAIFSQRKFLPLTEGGMAVSRSEFTRLSVTDKRTVPFFPWLERLSYSIAQNNRCRAKDANIKNHMVSIAGIAMSSVPAIACKVVKRLSLVPRQQWLTPEAEGPTAIPVYQLGVSALSKRIWRCSDAAQLVKIRRRHFMLWMRALENQSLVAPLIKALPDGMCPLCFPVVVSHPARIVDRMKNNDIEVFNWWYQVPPELAMRPPEDFAVALALKQKVIALPLHQSIHEKDIAHMAHCLLQAAKLPVNTDCDDAQGHSR